MDLLQLYTDDNELYFLHGYKTVLQILMIINFILFYIGKVLQVLMIISCFT